MVHNYVRKTDRASWSEESLKKAMREAQIGTISSASKKYGIPFATLHRHLKTGSSQKKLGRFETVFTPAEEADLVAYVKKMDSIFYGLTRSEFLQVVGEFAKKIDKEGVFSGNIAGKGWFKKFRSRHPELVLRTPEPTSIARVKGFNRVAVDRFYTLLEEVIEKYNIVPEMIFNVDETGVTTTSNRPPKVLSTYGKKQVGVVSSNERGVLTTVVCCCSVTSTYIPPFFIFKRKKFDRKLLDGSQPGSEAAITDSGWINADRFLNWLQIFVQKVRPTEDRKALLLLDNHESHKSYTALEYASKNNVVFLSIPPHTSHRLQPLDVAVYGPIKKYFEAEVNSFQKSHPGRIINQYDVAKLFTSAYLRGATPANAISGFRSSGIYPFDRHAIGDEHFAPSEVYQALDQSGADSELHDVVHIEPVRDTQEEEQSSSTTAQCSLEQPALEPELLNDDSEREPEKNLQERDQPNPPETVELHNDKTTDPELQDNVGEDHSQANVSNMEILLEIRPIPKEVNKRNNKGRKPQKAEVLTSTPVKLEQKKKQDAASAKKKIKFDSSTAVPATKSRDSPKARHSSKAGHTSKAGPSSRAMPPEKAGPSGVKRRNAPKKGSNESSKEYRCTFCKELYVHPPTEDWIQCSSCQEWTHESCSSYTGFGSFFCEDCFD
ncbi:hypothetical protein O0L34_g1061 [Tuta absoluta]|nr:hypothetical protein O0L34_g1061 [Tuta absoluta]